MRKLLLFFAMLFVSIGAWAVTYEMRDYNPGNLVATLSVEGGVATIVFVEPGGNAGSFDMGAMGNTSADGITEVIVKGPIPENVSDQFLGFFNNANYGVLQNCTRMDFSQASGKLPSSVHNKVNGVILPNDKSFNDVSGGNYIIIANTGDSEENAVEVLVKNGTDWASDPMVDDASYLKVYDSDGTTYLESEEVTALQSTKWVNGEGTVFTVEDLTIDADNEDEATVLTDFLVSHKINNLTVSGNVADLSIFDQVPVKGNVDFSGITNSDLSTLKLPVTNGTISLPGGTYQNGTVTLGANYTSDQLNNILAALSNSGKTVNTIEFAGGTIFNCATNELEVSTADENAGNLSSIASNLRSAGKTIDSVRLEKYGTSWRNDTMILSSDHADQETDQKNLLDGAGFTVQKVNITKFPDVEWSVENGVVTITSYREGALDEMFKPHNENDPEVQALKQALQDNQGEGSKLVLAGAFKKQDLEQLKGKPGQPMNQYETVDMSEATFSHSSDMSFGPWKETLKNAITSKYMPADYKVGKTNETFKDCRQLVSVTYNSGIVDGIANNASDVPNFTTVKIGPNVETIGKEAFKNITTLTTLDASLADNLSVIEREAFSGCQSFGGDGYGEGKGNFHVPNSVQTIEQGAFEACYGIVNLYFDAGSQINSIATRAFFMTDEGSSALKNVYVNVNPARAIECANSAFSKTDCCNQTQVGTVRVRLHYPREYYDHYVGRYKEDIYDQNLDENGEHAYGVITQSVLDRAYSQASNGWQEFMSSGIPVGENSLYRTYSEEIAYYVPDDNILQIYLVHNYDKEQNVATCVQMQPGDLIPAYTGLIIHSTEVATIYLPYAGGPAEQMAASYDNEKNPDNKYRRGDSEYNNYLKPINGALHIDNVESSNGKKTYRNYFFNNGTTAASRPGKDWKDDYAVYGWGFFRAASGDYTVWNKAFLHLPANMTEASSTVLDDSGTLPQDQQGGAKSFGLYLIGLDEVGGTTPIESLFETKESTDSYYTLQGVRVNTPAEKGIYIHNGKKVIVK